MPDRDGQSPRVESARVLSMDLVGYSRLSVGAQGRRIGALQGIVRDCPAYREAETEETILAHPAGDGSARSGRGGRRARGASHPSRVGGRAFARRRGWPTFSCPAMRQRCARCSQRVMGLDAIVRRALPFRRASRRGIPRVKRGKRFLASLRMTAVRRAAGRCHHL